MNLANLTTLKARLALARDPRRVALNLKDGDDVTLRDGEGELAQVTFRAPESIRVLILDLYTNGTYSVASSTTIRTHDSLEVLETYARGLKFIREYGLTPRV